MRTPFKQALVLTLFLALVAGCGNDGNGGSDDEPGQGTPYPEPGPNGEIQGQSNFAFLIDRYSEGKAAAMPWAGPWWPYSDNGIAFATERYEAATGNRGATAWERSRHGQGAGGESWWGHCNGWAVAATLYPEPRAPKSAGGQTFSVAEQKALLSEIGMEVDADFFGNRAESSSGPAFSDVPPNQFFLVLTNYLGKGLDLIIDRYTGYQVWNQPLAGYRVSPVRPSDYLGAQGNVHRVMLTTQIWWLRNDVSSSHQTEEFTFADGESYESRTLRYEVWLDRAPEFDGAGKLVRSGNVVLGRQGSVAVGGAWRNGSLPANNSHPDYMWVPHRVTASTGYTNPEVDVRWVSENLGR